MSNLFDSLQNSAYALVAKTMGYDAVWAKAGGQTETGRVLFNDPSKKYQLAGMDFQPAGWTMEYQAGTFNGLEEAVQSGETPQFVTISGQEYFVRQVLKEFDGKSYVAVLEEKEV